MTNEKMYVCNLHGIGDLRYEQIDIPECEDDEVLVKIKNCGICGSDIGRVLKNGTYHFPTVPGHEFSGEIVYDKDGNLTGKRVAVFPLLPCFECENCKKERYAQCLDYDYYGSRRNGGFAEYIAVKKFNLVELPENVSYEEGAMCEPLSVARHAIKKLNLEKGTHLLITGAGTIGLMAGMWAKSFGAERISFIDIDERKLDFCEKFGFERYDGKTVVDAVLEGTGAKTAIVSAVNAVKAGGNIVLMGNPSAEVNLTAKEYQMILRKEVKLLGTWNSSFSKADNDWKESMKAVSEGKIEIKELITRKVPLENCKEAICDMKKGERFCCKEMIENEK